MKTPLKLPPAFKMAKKGYWVGHIDVTNPERYKDYIAANAAPLKKYGARFLVRNGACEVYGDALQGAATSSSSSKVTQQPKPVTTHRSIRRRQGFVTRPAPPIS
jgi:hypothetical protein